MFQEFKKFIMRGNVLDLAIGVIIGAAFGAIVNSLVGDILTPIIGSITGGLDFSITFCRCRRRSLPIRWPKPGSRAPCSHGEAF